MYSEAEAVLAQYEIEWKNITKGRGCYIVERNEGKLLLTCWNGSKARGRWLRDYLQALKGCGFFAEQIYENRGKEVVTVDELSGEGFILKDYIAGTEISPSRWGEAIEAVQTLARYHLVAKDVMGYMEEKGMCAEHSGGYTDVPTVCGRHARQLHKVSKYIRTKKKKTEFERIYMQQATRMQQTAEKSLAVLEEEEQKGPVVLFCHGDSNHHNIIWTGQEFQMIHFENLSHTWAVTDLANYMRKILEKNGWDEELGRAILESYEKVRPLEAHEYRQIYGLLLFPERFWKLTNHYMNSNKVWIPEKDIEKLNKVIRQEELRLKFVENLFSIPQ